MHSPQVTTKKDSPYSGGPPYDAISEKARMQVVGESNSHICIMWRSFERLYQTMCEGILKPTIMK